MTQRQREVAVCLVAGMTHPETARHLHMATQTVKYHVWQLMRATGTQNACALGYELGRTGLLADEPSGDDA